MDNRIVQQLKSEVEAAGFSVATLVAMEFAAGAPFADVDALITALDAFVAAKDWLTGYTIDHARGKVLFMGPATEFVP